MEKKLIGSVGVCINFFVYSWIACYVIMTLMPVKPLFPNGIMNFFINIVFIIIVLLVTIFVYKLLLGISRKGLSSRVKIKGLGRKKLNFILISSSFGSIIGVFLILYDRIIIRGIDYSQGVRYARYQWMASAEAGMGGSTYSVIGNLFVPFSYVAISMVVLHWEKLNKKQRFIGLAAGAFVPLGHAVLNGGRSNVFILVILIICIFIIRRSMNRSFLPQMRGKYLKIIIAGLLALIFSMQIFSSSAKMTNSDSYEYTRKAVLGLRGQLDQDKYNVDHSYEFVDELIAVGAYLYHGQWVTQESFTLTNKPGGFTFFAIKHLLRTAGLYKKEIEPDAFSDLGIYISLPGALYYDYDFFGVFIGSFLIGILFGITLFIIKANCNKNGFHLAFVIQILALLYLSPIAIVNGFVYFNFIIFAFVSMEVLSRILYGYSSWVYLDL